MSHKSIKKSWRLQLPLRKAVLLSTLSLVALGRSATIPWAVPADGNWAAGSNWTGGVAPADNTATDFARFALSGSHSVQLSGNRSVARLYIDSGSPDFAFGPHTLNAPGLIWIKGGDAKLTSGTISTIWYQGYQAGNSVFTLTGNTANVLSNSGNVGYSDSSVSSDANALHILNEADFTSTGSSFSIGILGSSTSPSATSNGNLVQVSGAGSTFSASAINIGYVVGGNNTGRQANNNSLVINDGGVVNTGYIQLGRSFGTNATTTGNTITVGGTGTGSQINLTSAGQTFFIGHSDGSNVVNVNTGGMINATASDTEVVGHVGNSLRVSGGTYNAAGRTVTVGDDAKMHLGAGGSITASQIVVQAGGRFGDITDATEAGFTGGTLNVATMTYNPATTFRIGDEIGTNDAIHQLAGGVHSFGGGVRIGADGRLSGNGTVKGIATATTTLQIAGAVAPGLASNEISTLNVSGDVTFESGRLEMDVKGSASDLLAVTGAVSLNGSNDSLLVDFNNTAPASTRFVLITQTGTVNGAFENLQILNDPSGLTWSIDTTTAGQVAIRAIIPPSADVWRDRAAVADLNINGGNGYSVPSAAASYTLAIPAGTYTMPWTRLPAESLVNHEVYLLDAYNVLYESHKERLWLDKLISHVDRMIAPDVLVDLENDGRRGWATPYYSRNRADYGGFNQFEKTGFSVFTVNYLSHPKSWTKRKNGSVVAPSNNAADNAFAYRSTTTGDFTDEGTSEIIAGYGVTIADQAGLVLKTPESSNTWTMEHTLSGYRTGAVYEVSFQGRTSRTSGVVEIINATDGATLARYEFASPAWSLQRFAFTAPVVSGKNLLVRVSVKDPFGTGGQGTVNLDALKIRALSEYALHDGLVLAPIARFIALVLADADLAGSTVPGSSPATTYGDKATAYLSLIDTNFVERWDANWQTFGTNQGCFKFPDDDSVANAGYWTGASLPLNQNAAFHRFLINIHPCLPEGSRKAAVADKIVRLANYTKARLAANPVVPNAWQWNYADNLFSPADDARGVSFEDISHANEEVLAAQDFRRARAGFPSAPSTLLNDDDLSKFASTLMSVMYSGSNGVAAPFGTYVNNSEVMISSYSQYVPGWLELCEQNPSIHPVVASMYSDPSLSPTSAIHVLTMARLSHWNPRRVWNRGFEYATDAAPALPAGWTRWQDSAGVYVQRDVDPAHVRHGKASLRISPGGGIWHTAEQNLTGLTPNANYRLTFHSKCESSDNGARIEICSLDDSDPPLRTGFLHSRVLTNTDWQQGEISLTAPANGRLQIRCYYAYLNATSAVWFDDLNLEEDTSPPVLTISSIDGIAAEYAPPGSQMDTAVIRLSRSGATANPLDVPVLIGGTATNGTDHTAIASTVTIPSGASFADVAISPILDAYLEGSEDVVFNLLPDLSYRIGQPGSASVTITDKPSDAWRASAFGADANNPAIAGDTVDYDGDGLANLMEYALGTDPKAHTPASARPTFALDGAFFSFTYQRPANRPDIQYKVQKSSTLEEGTWNRVDVDGDGDGFIDGTHERISGQGVDPETWRATMPTAGRQRLFMRLKIMPPDS